MNYFLLLLELLCFLKTFLYSEYFMPDRDLQKMKSSQGNKKLSPQDVFKTS